MTTDRIFSRYLYGITLGLIIAMGGTGLFNWLIDPYGIWQIMRVEGLNQQKSERRDQNYLFKAVDLMYKRPKTLIIGSSRVAFGLDPEHPVFDRKQLAPVYNAALTGGHLHALRRYVEHAIYNNPDLEVIIWGIDFFAFNSNVKLAPSYKEDRLVRKTLLNSDMAEALWSLDALSASWRTVKSNNRRPEYTPYYDNGQLSAMDMAEQVRSKGMILRFDQSLKLYLNSNSRFANYQNSPAAWQEFEHTLRMARQNGITVHLFVPPVHMAMLEALQQRSLWPIYAEWLRRIAQIHPFTDFSGPGAITGESIGQKMNYYWDVSHFRSSVGDHILPQLFEYATKDPLLIGTAVKLSSIDEHLSDLEERSGKWLRNNPDIVQFVVGRISPIPQ